MMSPNVTFLIIFSLLIFIMASSVSGFVSSSLKQNYNSGLVPITLKVNDKHDESFSHQEKRLGGFGFGRRQMRSQSQRGFTQQEIFEQQRKLSQRPRGVDDGIKHPSNRNKTKRLPVRPVSVVPFFNIVQSSSQENPEIVSGKKVQDEKEDTDLSSTKRLGSYYIGSLGDFGPTGVGGNAPRIIRCVCNTSECVPRNGGINGNATTCLTGGMCYTQILDYGDGRPPVSKGCISGGGENLLCENRKPKNAKIWPLVGCCNTDLCNAGLFPPTRKEISPSLITPSAATRLVNQSDVMDRNEQDENFELEDTPGGRHEKAKSDNHHPDNEDAIRVWTPTNLNGKKTLDSSGRISPLISPLASSFLIGGAVVVIVISAIGFYILRREQSQATMYYRKQLERRGRSDEIGDEHDEGEDRELQCESSHHHSNHIKETCLNLTSISIGDNTASAASTSADTHPHSHPQMLHLNSENLERLEIQAPLNPVI